MSTIQPPALSGIPAGMARVDVSFAYSRPDRGGATRGFIRVDVPAPVDVRDVRDAVASFLGELSTQYGFAAAPIAFDIEVIAAAVSTPLLP